MLRTVKVKNGMLQGLVGKDPRITPSNYRETVDTGHLSVNCLKTGRSLWSGTGSQKKVIYT